MFRTPTIWFSLATLLLCITALFTYRSVSAGKRSNLEPLGSAAPVAMAATFTVPLAGASLVVNSISDADNGADGVCTLREAITAANNNANYHECTSSGYGADTITFSVSGTITLGSTLPAINDDVTIDGTGQSIIVSGNNSVQVMTVNGGKTLTLLKLTIANGQANLGGGGIINSGTLNVTNSTFSGNGATFNGGGGIFNIATLNVTNSTFSGNSTGFIGGGIYNSNNGTANVTNSTFSGNSAPGGGGAGGIFNFGTMTVTNSTFSGNSAGNQTGGGIRNDGTLSVTNSTFSGNSDSVLGGGIFNQSAGTLNVTNSTFSGNSAGVLGGGIFNGGTLNFSNTIVANTSSGGDCGNVGTIGTARNNLIQDSGNACGLTNGTNGNIIGFNPNLGSLANNGGPTQTMALLAGSPAIDAGDDATCAAAVGPPNFGAGGKDQRGVTRPVGAHCDIGAFERLCPPTITCPASITKFPDSGQFGATINPSAPVAVGDCNPVTVSGVRSDGKPLNALYPIGITLITWTARDAFGGSASCGQTIMVMTPSSQQRRHP